MDLPPDVIEQLDRDFPPRIAEAPQRQLAAASDSERIQRCIVFAARGHPWYFDYLCRLARIDWRDVIVAAEYDHLEVRTHDFNRPIPDARLADPYGPDGA